MNKMMVRKDDDAPQKELLTVKYMKVFGAVALYWSVSICMVFLNKYLLKVKKIFMLLYLFVFFISYFLYYIRVNEEVLYNQLM